MSTTLLIPSAPVEGVAQPPRRVALAFPSPHVAHSVALNQLGMPVGAALALQLVALALAWPADVPAPWLAGPEEELKGLRKRVEGGEAWLAESARKGNAEDVAQAKRELRERRVALAEGEARLRAASITLSNEPSEIEADADRILASLPTVPPVKLYRAGRDLIAAAAADAFRGYEEYDRLVEQGFSAAPRGSSSGEASSSPETTGATPSPGST